MLDFTNCYIIGLTGMSGAGKTKACEVFAENGFVIINCDVIAREITRKNSPCLHEIIKNFSLGIIKSDGELDREKVAELIFTDSENKKKYEKIIFPYILFNILNKIHELSRKNEKFILLDAPTLFESGAVNLCDSVISVIADYDIILKRVIARDKISEIQARTRLSAQKNVEFYINNSDFYILNNSDLEELKLNINRILKNIKYKKIFR